MSGSYRVVLRFEEEGPSVTGWWDTLAAAERTYTGWIGLYGSHPTARIQLLSESTQPSTVLREWASGSEVLGK